MADESNTYDTKLSDQDEAKFQSYLNESGRQGDLADYDLRGWWKKNGKTDARGHMTDEFKKPNHPTFSKQSKYNGIDGNEGGEWIGSDKDGWTFKASKGNLKNMSKEELQDYFSRVEPNSKLELPEDDDGDTKRSPLYDHPRSP